MRGTVRAVRRWQGEGWRVGRVRAAGSHSYVTQPANVRTKLQRALARQTAARGPIGGECAMMQRLVLRHRSQVTRAAVGGICVTLLACRASPVGAPHTLSSGRTIRVVYAYETPHPELGSSLVLSYQTNLKISDEEALLHEVIEILGDIQRDPTWANVKGAIVTANEAPSGWLVRVNQAHRFTLARKSDGNWLVVGGRAGE